MNINLRNGTLVNLRHMWKANKAAKHKPAEWLRQKDTREFISALLADITGVPAKGASGAPLKDLVALGTSSGDVVRLKSVMGRYGGTYAHWQIAMAHEELSL